MAEQNQGNQGVGEALGKIIDATVTLIKKYKESKKNNSNGAKGKR